MPAGYSVRELQAATPELIYVQPYVTGDFSAQDGNDMYNLKHYVTAPAVIMSDRVIVPSENMRLHYIEKLTAFAGDESRKTWERVISVLPGSKTSAAADGAAKDKRLLFCIGLNELTELGEAFLPALEQRLKVFTENSGSILTEVTMYPPCRDMWTEAEPVLAGCVFEAVKVLKPAGDREQQAYYGSPSPYVLEFSQSGRPVMIADFKLDT